MDERFLHYVWKFQKLNGKLKTIEGHQIIVINQGTHNHNSGPDFEEARIKIGDIEWAGKIEIHVNSSDWKAHNHHRDKAYSSVILHVVWKHDSEVLVDGQVVPTLEVKNLIKPEEFEKYRSFIKRNKEILCHDQLSSISNLSFTSLLDRMMVERLEQKAIEVLELVSIKNADWEEVAYLSLARNFGFSTNKEAFFAMANSLPYRTVAKNSSTKHAIEALFFGQSGFLNEPGDDYHKELRTEFDFLKSKHQLPDPLMKERWKFGRMRMPNFPTVRLAQFAALMAKNDHLFSRLIEVDTPQKVIEQFEFQVSDYWDEHYDFGKKRKKRGGNMGKSSVDNLIINTIAPLFAAYSKYSGDQRYMDRAVRILELIPPENNSITKKWSAVGREPKNASDSQSLIGLFKNYCSKRKCLDCSVGVEILER